MKLIRSTFISTFLYIGLILSILVGSLAMMAVPPVAGMAPPVPSSLTPSLASDVLYHGRSAALAVQDDAEVDMSHSPNLTPVPETMRSMDASTPAPYLAAVSLASKPAGGSLLASIPALSKKEVPFLEPAGCRQPGDDYTRVRIAGHVLNQRTLEMLEYADILYDGSIDITEKAILRGGYAEYDIANADLYLGGGVVDLSITNSSGEVLYHEVEPLIKSLRTAGFAAWLRDKNEAYLGSLPYIHAVAIGDERLSEAALTELLGSYGYFRGYSGIIPQVDRYGGPVVCNWMEQEGYRDLRTASSESAQWPNGNWQQKLKEAAAAYLTDSMEESVEVARELDFLAGVDEHPANMCGPLAGAILRDAGLLPYGVEPAFDLYNYWLADPKTNGRPWSLFPRRDYDVYEIDTAINKFDFTSWPLMPGDFVYTHAIGDGFDHMFVVTEVDEAGRAYTVANERQSDGTYLIQRLLLYDPTDLLAGVFKNDWVNDGQKGRTGQAGFDVLRRRGIGLQAGDYYEYVVRPGDTIMTVASRYNSSVVAIASQNGLRADDIQVPVGETLVIPVNIYMPDDVPQPQDGVSAEDKLIEAAQEQQLVAVPVVSYDALAVEESPSYAADLSLQREVELIMRDVTALSGEWGVYIENLDTGEVVSINEEHVFHPASTIKIAVGVAFLHWLDEHPKVKLTNGPVQGQRSYEQLLKAMLIKSEEEATKILVDFLAGKDGYEVQTMLDEWGLVNTTIRPRRTTVVDQALLLKKLQRGELLSEDSTGLLLEILSVSSNGDNERIGGGLPGWARQYLAHKPGTVFDDGWGVVSDIGLVDTEGGSYVIVVLSNYVDWIHYDEAMQVISDISASAFKKNTQKDFVVQMALEEMETPLYIQQLGLYDSGLYCERMQPADNIEAEDTLEQPVEENSQGEQLQQEEKPELISYDQLVGIEVATVTAAADTGNSAISLLTATGTEMGSGQPSSITDTLVLSLCVPGDDVFCSGKRKAGLG